MSGGASATRDLALRLARSLGADLPPIETHASIVVLAGDRAWKFRKAVDLGFLDYTTIEARRRDCEEELRLNRRLAPSVYRGVRGVVEAEDGSVRLVDRLSDGEQAADWVVEMRRLPAEGMLDQLLARGAVPAPAVAAFADDLAAFHTSLGPAEASLGSAAAVRTRLEANLERLRRHAVERTPILTAPLVDRLADGLRERFKTVADRLERRAGEGRVREGHGDLHARNLCLVDGRLVAYDCLQFDRALRTVDVASEVGFLAMDLEIRGGLELAETFVDRYVAASGDAEVREVLPFFTLHYAIIRAMVDSIRAAEPAIDEASRAAIIREVREHALLAAEYVRGPVLVLVAGLPLTGKSTLAKALARPLRAAIVRSDEIRKGLAGIAPTSRGDAALYREDFTERTYAAVAESARARLAARRSVIVDAAALRGRQRALLRSVATDEGRPAFLLWASAERSTIAARAEARARDASEASDADLAVHDRLAAIAEPPTEWPTRYRLRAPAERPSDELVAMLAETILTAGRDEVGDGRG